MPRKLKQKQGESDKAFAERQETQRENNRLAKQRSRDNKKEQAKAAEAKVEKKREQSRLSSQRCRDKKKEQAKAAQDKLDKRRERNRLAKQRQRSRERKQKGKQGANLTADEVVANLDELAETQATTTVDFTDLPSTFEAELAADDVVTNLEELDETQASTIVDDTDIPSTSEANLTAIDTSMARSVEQLSSNHDNRLAMVATRHDTAVAGNSSGHHLAVGNVIHPHLHPYQLAEKIENSTVQIFNIQTNHGVINCGTSGITREDVQQMIDRRLAGNVQVNYNNYHGTVNQYSGTSGIALTREDVQQMIDRRAEDVIQTVQSSAARKFDELTETQAEQEKKFDELTETQAEQEKKFDELTETQAEQAIVLNDTKNAVDQHTNVMNENQAKQEKKVDELTKNQAVQRKELNQLTETQAKQAIVVNNTKNAVNHNARNARVRHKVLKQTRDDARDDVNYLHERIDDTNECLASHRAWIDYVREGCAAIKTKRPERSVHKNNEKENNV